MVMSRFRAKRWKEHVVVESEAIETQRTLLVQRLHDEVSYFRDREQRSNPLVIVVFDHVRGPHGPTGCQVTIGHHMLEHLKLELVRQISPQA